MAATTRAARITKLVSALKKQFKPVAPVEERTLLENLLFACLLENSLHDAAETAFQRLNTDYFDWNEVRVSTRRELAGELKELNDPDDAADRIKRTLQSTFEAVYTFDLELLKKQNLGQTIKQFQSFKGVSPFVIAYATQTSLGGHSIPINDGLFTAFIALEIITEAEAKSGTAPGLERTIPKSKGVEVGSMMHQLGVEVGKNPYGQNARKLLLAIDPGCKDNLPKRPAKPVEAKPAAPPKQTPEKAPEKTPPGKAGATKSTKAAATKKPAEEKTGAKASSPKQPPAKPAAAKPTKKVVKKAPTKKTSPDKNATPAKKKAKPAAAKKTAKKVVKKKTNTKRKPK